MYGTRLSLRREKKVKINHSKSKLEFVKILGYKKHFRLKSWRDDSSSETEGSHWQQRKRNNPRSGRIPRAVPVSRHGDIQWYVFDARYHCRYHWSNTDISIWGNIFPLFPLGSKLPSRYPSGIYFPIRHLHCTIQMFFLKLDPLSTLHVLRYYCPTA